MGGLKIEGGFGGGQGGEDAQFEVEGGQVAEHYGIHEKARIFEDGLGHDGDGLCERPFGVEAADTAAQAVGAQFVEGDETTGQLVQLRIVGEARDGMGGEGGADGVARQIKQERLLFGGQLHLGQGRKKWMPARSGASTVYHSRDRLEL